MTTDIYIWEPLVSQVWGKYESLVEKDFGRGSLRNVWAMAYGFDPLHVLI